jgi:hypothetical protein
MMKKIFYLEDNRMLSLFTENDDFLLNNPIEIVNKFYTVFRLEPNVVYTKNCIDSDGQLAVFEREIDALNFGIEYVKSMFGVLNDSPS